MEEKIKFDIIIPDSKYHESGIIFSIKNNENFDLYFDSFNTPFEDIFPKCIRVVNNNDDKEIPFDGLFVKHDYKFNVSDIIFNNKIKSKDVFERQVNLHDYYKIQESGSYTIELLTKSISFYSLENKDNVKKFLLFKNLNVQSFINKIEINKYDNNEHLTLGEKSRIKVNVNKYYNSSSCQVLFDINTPNDQNLVILLTELHFKSYKYICNTVSYLENENNHIFIQLWFGITITNIREYLLKQFKEIKINLENYCMVYIITNTQLSDYFASGAARIGTNINTNITLYPRFFNSQDEGADSKIGTLVHEFTHSIALNASQDFVFGRKCSYMLANRELQKEYEYSYHNSDNLQGFAEDINVFNYCKFDGEKGCKNNDCRCSFERQSLKC